MNTVVITNEPVTFESLLPGDVVEHIDGDIYMIGRKYDTEKRHYVKHLVSLESGDISLLDEYEDHFIAQLSLVARPIIIKK